MRLLTAEDVRAALNMRVAIDAVREGFIALSSGKASVPVRSVMTTPHGTTLTMPAYIEGSPVSVVKVVSVHPQNPARGMPTVLASVIVLDANSGLPLAMMDGTSLTAIRTGAASGLATDLLARTDASVLGVIGSGVQAATQIQAVLSVRPITLVRIYSPNHAPALVTELHKQFSGIEFAAAATARDALRNADVIVAATDSKTPVVLAADVKPGAHINGVGSFTPQMQEVAADVLTSAKIVVDHRASIWSEAGDLIIPLGQGLISEASIYAEIGEIAAGRLAGRTSEREVTFFKSVGNAVQDAAAAQRVFMAAEARDLGTTV